jgi:23S rRNA pseudouridine1911/1915/1917 synthase
MEKNKKFIVENSVPIRLDSYLAILSNLSRSRIKSLCDDGLVFVNGVVAKANKIVKNGEVITFTEPEAEILDLTPKNIDICVVYQDDDLAVINKPQGLTVHAGNGTDGDTLVNALLYHLDKLSSINGVVRPGIVHRIDKNTSGLLVVAKNDKAHLFLSSQLQDKTLNREYVALLEGNLKTEEGVISTFINRDKKDRTKMAVCSTGKDATTRYKVIKRYEGYTLVKFNLETGRTHQIRVHAKYIGHPVVGDPEYGYKSNKFKLKGQLLHARKIEFLHPTLNKKMSFSVEVPVYFNNVLKKLKEI